MRRKGITIWELYIERFVLGAAVLFLVGFTAWQFLSEPNTLEQGRETIRPDEINERLRASAEDLRGRLTPAAPSPMEIPDPPSVLDDFRSRLDTGVSPVARIEPSNRGAQIATGVISPTERVAYVTPSVPAPESVVTQQYFDAITEEAVSAMPDLQDRLGDAPYDTTWVTAAAVFDRDAVLDEFRRRSEAGAMQIPQNWYGGRVRILDVRLEREELIDGEWTGRMLLSPLVGQMTLRDELSTSVDKATRDDMLSRLADEAAVDALLRPGFYPLTRGSFYPPDPSEPEVVEDVTLSAEEQALRRLKVKHRKLTGQREQVLRQLEELGESAPSEPVAPAKPDQPDRPRGGEGGGRRAPTKPPKAPPGAGVGVGMTGGGDGGRDAERDRKKADQLRKRAVSLTGQIARVEEQITTLGGVIDAVAEQRNADEDTGEMIVWAHDETIVPGATYRYRFTLDVYNPFFARKLDLLESQHGLADSITLASASSAWSEARETIPRTQVFVTKAFGPGTGRGQLGLGQATAEVYRFTNARWWLETFNVEPGDRVGGVEELRRPGANDPTTIDYGTEWYVLDIVDDIDADRQESDRGLGAWVLLQEVDDPDDIVRQSPATASVNRMRDRLKTEVELAEDEAVEVAVAGDESAG